MERFDPALLQVAQQISGDAGPSENPIETLLDVYFSFLRRKTDFFRRVCSAACRALRPALAAAARRALRLACATSLARLSAPLTPRARSGGERARAAVLAALDRQAAIEAKEAEGASARGRSRGAHASPPAARARDAAAAAKRAESVAAERMAREAAAGEAAAAEEAARRARLRAAAAPEPPKCTISELSEAEAAAEEAKAVAEKAGLPAAEAADADAEEEADKGKQAPNAGNGGEAEWGSWVQTLTDCELRVSVPFGTAARDVEVVVKRQHIKVGLKGQPPLLDGVLFGEVKSEDSLWTMEDKCKGAALFSFSFFFLTMCVQWL